MPSKTSKPKQRKTDTVTSPKQQQPSRPDWPALYPLLPTQDLALQVVSSNQIITIPQLWTSTLCKIYVQFLSTLPLITTPGKPKKGDAVRVNDRFQIDDPVFARQLWQGTGLQYLLTTDEGSQMSELERKELWGGEVVGLNPNIRVYRYSKGQFFDQHFDESNLVTLSGDDAMEVKARTTWTLLLYLTSQATGCTGGETVFYPEPTTKKGPVPEPIVVGMEVGMALLHRHGKECMLHEGREVTVGEKWVIRSDLCVKR